MLAKEDPSSDLTEALALRLSAGFCMALGAFFDWEVSRLQPHYDLGTIASYLPYFFIVIHPRKLRILVVGLSLGFPFAAAMLTTLASGLARTPEAHVPFLCFAAANLLTSAVAFRECLRLRLLGRGLLWAFALAGIIYIWVCAAF